MVLVLRVVLVFSRQPSFTDTNPEFRRRGEQLQPTVEAPTMVFSSWVMFSVPCVFDLFAQRAGFTLIDGASVETTPAQRPDTAAHDGDYCKPFGLVL